MNIEYVYLILTGINESIEREEDNYGKSLIFQNFKITGKYDWNVTDSKFASRNGSVLNISNDTISRSTSRNSK
jgi:hypothetical protein